MTLCPRLKTLVVDIDAPGAMDIRLSLRKTDRYLREDSVIYDLPR
jgi:hypothetical protein